MDRLRPGSRAGLLASLPLALLLGGCFGDIDMAPFGRTDPLTAPDSLTVRRVMGIETTVPPLAAEPGNVWPAQEAPRATLQNPDSVTVPPQERSRSEGLERAREQRGRAPEGFAPNSQGPGPALPPEVAPNPRAPAPGTRRRGSSGEPLPPLDPPPLPRAGVPRGAPATPPEPRLEGTVLPVPGGPPAIITGGSGSVQTYTQPGVGTGTAIRQGGTTTLIAPDGTTQVVPNPR
ncbi:hypothetical protein J8J14_19985 [Roseomonas sp. SSH11]|uniref:Uncharacterized protein n=1 Tax=Pararoseomonas baculiformis TaxID=2820812 RepID=A0ABS4AJ50_9PROT|nr:hypothetical protein [Pararoseomonas baculiformis]MBP0447059.1 hypothetical protein [Pararoseomonas baculiformis]